MAQQKRKRSKKWISTVIVILLLIAAGVVCYFVWDAYFRDKKTPEPNNGTVVVGDDSKKDEKKTEEKKSEEKYKQKEETSQYEGLDPNSNEHLTGAVTHARVSGDKVIIRVNIDQYLSSGTCELKIKSNGSDVYSDSASIIDSASTSTCEGFNVPLNSVPAGNLNIEITLSSGDKTGLISGVVEVNK